MTRRHDWLQHAACGGNTNPAWTNTPNATTTDLDNARRTCLTCPALTDCHTWATREQPAGCFAAGKPW